MMIATVSYAPPGERYSPGAFDGTVGDTVPWTIVPGGPPIGHAHILAVRVSGDGQAVHWLLDLCQPGPVIPGTGKDC